MDEKRCDLIIPVWNQLDLTRDCIDAISRNTKFPYALIVIDNASGQETKDYLEGLKTRTDLNLTLIRNEDNLGYVKAVNQALKISRAEYACVFNNDTQVAPGWLTEMIAVAESKDDIGTVNPDSNTLGKRLRPGQGLESMSEELKVNKGKWSELAWTTGFCMLIKKRVLEEIGFFDEIYGMGYFEDADFCKRAQQKGYLSVCAQAAYCYHRERSSFLKRRTFNQDFIKNRETFHAKWGTHERILYTLKQADPAYCKKVNSESLKLARDGHMVWIFLPKKDEGKVKKQHSNIYIHSVPGRFFTMVCLWRILKRKKRFTKIVVDKMACFRGINRLKFIHKAEVIHGQ